MPIEGDLKSLNLSSVLQLIAQERLTGVLKIKRKNEVVDIGFAEGEVTGAFYEKGAHNERLEAYLVRSGMIGKNVYEMIEEIHNETKRPIMNIILEDRYLTLAEVERIIKFKIQEVFDELFTWEEGEFKFEQHAIIYPKSLIKIRMNTEGLILESARRFDEWPRIHNEIKSGDIVFKKVERPELKLKPPEDEARILSLLDGHRSVDDLVEISGLGKFHTYSCLYRLVSTGQITVAYAKPTPQKTRTKKQRSFKVTTVPMSIAIIVIVVLLEFVIGNLLARQDMLSFTIFNEDILDSHHEVYRSVFYYKHNRIPSPSEVKNIFEPYRR
jgi:hypothetical protein